MNGADHRAALAPILDGQRPASFSPLPPAVQILATQNTAEISGSTLRLHRDEDGRTESDQLSLYSPVDNTWSDPPLTDPDSDENSRSFRRYSTATSSASTISRLQPFATSSTSAYSSTTNHTAWCSTAAAPASRSCSACHGRISGQFVRALGTVFHFDCFRCADCNIEVASGYFPLRGSDGKQQPLCERDHFRRLDLTCARCKQALKESYIAACNKKFHAEHFTCSVCPKLLKPQGAWSRDGDVYCRRHYSMWSATNCTGCWTLVADPFVEGEIGSGKRWHRECFLLNKHWDIRLATSALHGHLPSESEGHAPENVQHGVTAANLTQMSTDALAGRIWTRLLEYEESSLACLSDIPRHVSKDMYLDAIRAAEKFVLHIEVLFAAIDELERAGAETLPLSSHAASLFRDTASLIMALPGDRDHSFASNSVPFEIRQERTVQALHALTPSLASHHKNLIIDTLSDALRLQRDNSDGNVLLKFLDRLRRFAMDGADPNADRQEDVNPVKVTVANGLSSGTTDPWYPVAGESFRSMLVEYPGGVAYGYRSLSPQCAGQSPTRHNAPLQLDEGGLLIFPPPPNNTCTACLRPIEEGCVRRGTYQRWHFHCFACAVCGKSVEDQSNLWEGGVNGNSSETDASSEVGGGWAPTDLNDFRCGLVPELRIYCTTHAVFKAVIYGENFERVSRLEQYAFFLNVAIRRSHYNLIGQGDILMSAVSWSESDRYFEEWKLPARPPSI